MKTGQSCQTINNRAGSTRSYRFEAIEKDLDPLLSLSSFTNLDHIDNGKLVVLGLCASLNSRHVDLYGAHE